MKIVPRDSIEHIFVKHNSGGKYHLKRGQNNIWAIFWKNDKYSNWESYTDSYIENTIRQGIWQKITKQEYYDNKTK